MKHWIRVLLMGCVLIFGGAPRQAAAAGSIQVDVPSAGESTIAPGRNFYVKGTYNLPAGYTASQVVINMYRYGSQEVVRRVQGNVKNPPLWTEGNISVSFNSWGSAEDIMNSKMPDLIWDGEDTASFYEGYRKCYFDDMGFAALIPGGEGEIDDGMDFVDENGEFYSVLGTGDYWLEVSVACHNSEGKLNVIKWNRQIRIGTTEDKLLARFSPDSHLERITEWARWQGYRIYSDPFAGNWWESNFEIPGELRASDMTEYSTGRSHFVIYNVSSGSTAYKVELARLQQQGVVNHADRLANYYYQYGEPVLKDGTESEITPFAAGDKLQFTRAEIGEYISGEEGIYDQDDAAVPQYDLDFSDGIQGKVGDKIAVYGVAAPIQISSGDIQEIGDGADKNSFLLNNKIHTLHYEITGDGFSAERDSEVALTRISGGWENPSELEFKHVLEITEEMAAKDLTVSVMGCDVYGHAVSGTEESFELHVAAASPGPGEPSVSPDPGPSLTPPPAPAPLPKPGKAVISSISSTPRTVTLKWKKVCSADRYAVYRYSSKKNDWIKVGETKKTAYKVTGLSPATDYWFRIRSIKQASDGRKSYGDHGTAKKILTRPTVPRKVRFRQSEKNAVQGKAVLIMNVSPRAEGYYIYQFKDGAYRKAYKIVGKKLYQRVSQGKSKVYRLAGHVQIKKGKLKCTLPGTGSRLKSSIYFRVRSYVAQEGYRQKKSLYSRPKKLQ